MDLNLTNPALQFPQAQQTDPTTGLPYTPASLIKFFKNKQAAMDQANQALQSVPSPQVSVTPPQVTGATSGNQPPGPLGMPGSSVPPPDPTAPNLQTDGGSLSMNTPSPTLPSFLKPSFQQVSQGPQGLPTPVNAGETKLGKLVHILTAAARGAAYGAGQGDFGHGFQAAEAAPYQQAERQQQLQSGQIGLAEQRANLQSFPLNIAQRQLAIQQAQEQLKQEQQGAKSYTYTRGPNGSLQYTPLNAYGKPGEPVPNAVNPFEMKPNNLAQATGFIGVGDNGEQFPVIFDKLHGGYIDAQTHAPVPNERVRAVSTLPSVKSSSSTTDLMGNTSETSTTQKALPGGTSAKPVRAAGGTPIVSGGQSGSTTPSNASTLPADVEQRLAGSGLRPNEQQYVRGLLNYQGQMPSPRAKNYAATLATLTSIDPSFDANTYEARKKTLNDYSPGGKVGQQVLAFNTAIRHLGTLSDAADALQNGQFPIANKLGNALSVQLGKDPVTNFNTIKTYLASELAKGFGGGVATDSSRSEAEGILNQAQSSQQLKGAFKAAVDLLQGKISAQETAFQAQMGKQRKLIDPGAQQVLNKLMGPAPDTHAWSAGAWQKANQGGDINAATAKAKASGFTVTP